MEWDAAGPANIPISMNRSSAGTPRREDTLLAAIPAISSTAGS
jgi:hypothetical protein